MGRKLGARVHVLDALEQRAFAGLIQPYQQQMQLTLLCLFQFNLVPLIKP
jgi:hypothetical protein